VNPVNNPAQLVTGDELELLWRIARGMGWGQVAYLAFCKRQCGVETPRTMDEYNKVLWPMKAISKRSWNVGKEVADATA
jgi:hypothetical protein